MFTNFEVNKRYITNVGVGSSGEPFVVKTDYKFKADPAFNQDGRLDKVSKKTPMERRGVEVEKIEKIIGSKGLSVSITGGGEVNDKKITSFLSW